MPLPSKAGVLGMTRPPRALPPSPAASSPFIKAPAMLPAPRNPIFFIPFLALSFAKDRPANAHERGAFLNSHRVIIGHAHRQLAQLDVRRAEPCILLLQPGQRAEVRTRGFGLMTGRRDRHQSVDPQA